MITVILAICFLCIWFYIASLVLNKLYKRFEAQYDATINKLNGVFEDFARLHHYLSDSSDFDYIE